MTRDILGSIFSLIATIEPKRNSKGQILEFLPHPKYRNTRGLSLNLHGQGPFCQFRIPAKLSHQGVYAIAVDGSVAYVGQCQNLSERFKEHGYGTIHPRNCFEQGQSTNCKVNHLILESVKQSRRIDLWFHRTTETDKIEALLISKINPPWNAQRKVPTQREQRDRGTQRFGGKLAGNSSAPVGLEGVVPIFKVTLGKAYYKQGFFNVKVEFDRFVRSTEGPVELLLGKSGLKVEGKVNRGANQNGTARIMGGAKLRDWFQANFEPGDSIDIDLGSLDSIRVGPTVVANLDESDETSSKKLEKTTSPDREVTPDDLTRWHRYLLRLLDALDERPALQEGVPSRINRLSRNGKVPREIAALMKVVSEVRNVIVHEGRPVSCIVVTAATNAWDAVFEWATKNGIQFDLR